MIYIPVISLWQPYASLIFTKAPGEDCYIKRHETRKRAPPLKYVGGYIGIQATAKFPPLKKISKELHELCMEVWGCGYNYTLPQGALLGFVRLSGGIPTEEARPASDDDRTAGDWRPGRFAWPLSDVTPCEVPLPMKGNQGWKKFYPPQTFGMRAAMTMIQNERGEAS